MYAEGLSQLLLLPDPVFWSTGGCFLSAAAFTITALSRRLAKPQRTKASGEFAWVPNSRIQKYIYCAHIHLYIHMYIYIYM